MDEDDVEVLIEELDSNEVPEAELSQFQVIEVIIPVDDMIVEEAEGMTPVDDVIVEEAEAALIQRYVCGGEKELPDLYAKLEPEEELDEETEVTALDLEAERALEKPCTSKAARSAHGRFLRGGAKKRNTPYPASDEDARMSDGDTASPNRPWRRRATVLNAALKGLMGEANLCYARGKIEMAEKICLEIIRQNPLAPEPFFTLAEIYESRDKEKYLNILTIAAVLNPHNRHLWVRVAEMHIAQGNYNKARVYYSKANKVLPRDYDLRLRKARLLEEMGEVYPANHAYLKMLPYLPFEQSALCRSTAQDVARYFHKCDKPALALEAMDSAYKVCGQLFSQDELNMYIELLMLNRAFDRVLPVLMERTGLQLETEFDDWEACYGCEIPDDMVPEFRTKLCVCLVHLQAKKLYGYIIEEVHKHMPPADSDHLNLYVDIAEAFIQNQRYAEAIDLLRPITEGAQQEQESAALVWLRQAECLRQLNRINEAIESLMHVVKVAPFCYEAKLTLSTLLKQQGRHIEATRALEQPADAEGETPARLLYERCRMLYEIGQVDDFLDVGHLLLARSSLVLQSREELMALAGGGNGYNIETLKSIVQMRNLIEESGTALLEFNKSSADNSDLTVQEEYELFLQLVRTATVHRRHAFIERLSFAMMTTKRFIDYRSELERIVILACYFNDDCALAFSYLRELITKQLTNNSLWNLFALLVQKGQDLRYNRYVIRLFRRRKYRRELQLFVANYYLNSNSYKYALRAYGPLYKETQNPLVSLCMAVAFNQLAMQKRVLRRTAAVAQAIAFAHKYAELRAGGNADIAAETHYKCAAQHEINYNMARIYHQAGVMHLALAYYERALAAHDPIVEQNEEILGLKQEIAFNIHLIYKASGNKDKARQYLYKYCVV